MKFRLLIQSLAAAAILAVSAPHADAAPYSTEGNPQALGLVITVDGPDGWEQQGTGLGNIIQRWDLWEPGVKATLYIYVSDMPNDIIRPESTARQLFSSGEPWWMVYHPERNEELVEKLGMEMICKADGCGINSKSVIRFALRNNERAYNANRRLWLFNRKRAVMIQLNATGWDPAVLKGALDRYDPVWNKFIDSLSISNWHSR